MLCAALLLLAAGCSGAPSHPASSTSSSQIPSSVSTTTSSSSEQTTTTLEQIAFFSPEQGYGLFERRSSGDSKCTWLVAKTTDGGTQFSELGVVEAWPCAGSPDASSLAFDNHGDGFVYGPKLFVTHNGGVTWMPQTQPGVVTAVSALGYSVWMIEGVCPAGAPALGGPNCPLRLFESPDGGRIWEPSPSSVPGATVSTGALTLEPAQGQSWLLRTNQWAGYVVSDPTPAFNGSADSVPLWHTSDDGLSWTAENIPCGVDALSAAVSLAPDGTLTAVCAGQPSAGAQLKSTSTSIDNGHSWSVYSPCAGSISSQCVSASPLNFGYLGTIDAVTAETAFLVGGRSSLLVTRDGGKGWQPVMPLIGGTDSGTDQVIFFDEQHGVVLGTDSGSEEPAIWTTRDAGYQWSREILSIT